MKEYKNIIKGKYKGKPLFINWFIEQNFIIKNVIDVDNIESCRQQIIADERGLIK